MESLENIWRKMKISDKESGVKCSKESLSPRLILAEFFAHTFKPLWRTQKEFKIKDIGENKFYFDFDEEYGLDGVVEHEPWTYDKHLVIFERVVENIPISTLSFRFSSCWVQIHDLLVHFLTLDTRDSIGSSLGTLLNMTDSEEEGNEGSYLRFRVHIYISKPLIRVYKVWFRRYGDWMGSFEVRMSLELLLLVWACLS